MSREGLITYLNDHLAGSVAALELLDHLIRLAAAAVQLPRVRHLDFAALENRAQNQFQRVDRLRLQAAPAALSL